MFKLNKPRPEYVLYFQRLFLFDLDYVRLSKDRGRWGIWGGKGGEPANTSLGLSFLSFLYDHVLASLCPSAN